MDLEEEEDRSIIDISNFIFSLILSIGPTCKQHIRMIPSANYLGAFWTKESVKDLSRDANDAEGQKWESI